MTKPAHHRPLNTHQIKLLILLYKFRFATAQLITTNQSSKYTQVIQGRLQLLLDQVYIGRNYDSSYKIQGKPATYYLLPEAIRYLKVQPYTQPKTIRSISKDKNAPDHAVAHYINTFTTYIALQRLYPGIFNCFSKSELPKYAYLPQLTPDMWIKRITRVNNLANDYFLDCYEEVTPYRLKIQRIREYIEYAEDDTKWKQNTKRPLPTLLMVCETEKLMGQLLRLATRELENCSVDLKAMATTQGALQGEDGAIWHKAEYGSKELHSLV